MRASINVDHIARIEGHGNVHVVIEDNEVKTVQMEVVEPARLFESMVRGRSFTEVSYISSRICGIWAPHFFAVALSTSFERVSTMTVL